MAISQEMHKSSVNKINMKITHLKCHWNLPGANEFNTVVFCSHGDAVIWHVRNLFSNSEMKDGYLRNNENDRFY